MAFFDLPLEELQAYRPDWTVPADLAEFWQHTLTEARAHPLRAVFEPVSTRLSAVRVFDTSFAGWGGHRIKAWLIIPAHVENPVSCIVEYLGYSGGRGLPHQWLTWPAAGHATLVMDTRGQGWSLHHVGDTVDPVGTDPAFPGRLTQGLHSRESYYYRRVYTDAVRAIDAARAHPAIDPERIGVTGISQGGGIAIAAAALTPDLAAAAANVPFLCGIRRATELSDAAPYTELVQYLRTHSDQIASVFDVLSYFDAAALATMARIPALFSAGLMDDVCPPSGIHAAYNRWNGPKHIHNYPYNQHEGGGAAHTAHQLDFFARHLA